MEEDEMKETSETPEPQEPAEHFELRPLEEILKDLEEKLQNPPQPEKRSSAAEKTAQPEDAAEPVDTECSDEAGDAASPDEQDNAIGNDPEDATDDGSDSEVKPEKKRKEKEETMSWQESLLMSLHDVVYLLAVLIIVFVMFFRIVVVSGSSMYSTLWNGDSLLVMSNVLYGEPEYGDIIVASKNSFNDGEPIIKRVIATEGQTVDIDFDAGIVYVDGVALEEDYTYTLTTLSEGVEFPLTVSEGCVFAMGDNRDRSRDSRYPDIGLIDEREILGKALFLFWPGTGDDTNEAPRDFSRIGVLK